MRRRGHAEAAGRRVGHRHAERVRDRAERRSRGPVRDHRAAAALVADELEGVLAHELSHVAHKDVAVITVASFLGVIAGLIVRFAFYSQLFGGRGRKDQNTVAIFMAVMAVSAAVYAISFLLIRALSQTASWPPTGPPPCSPAGPRLWRPR